MFTHASLRFLSLYLYWVYAIGWEPLPYLYRYLKTTMSLQTSGFLSFAEHKRAYFEEWWEPMLVTIDVKMPR